MIPRNLYLSTALTFLRTVSELLAYYLQNRQEENDSEHTNSSISSSLDQRSVHEEDQGERKDSSSSLSRNTQCRHFSLDEIKIATNNFDDSCIIGKGGFGKVYKGTIDFGSVTEVAFKRLNLDSKQGGREFWAEIEMLSKFRHSHVVSLIGYCEKEMILVYEYMPNGSLEDHLHKERANGSSSPPLTWLQKLSICIGAARGLDYLHTGTGVQCNVIHRDIKTSNVLLDKNLAAKISDFGLSRISPSSQLGTTTNVYTDQIKGTFGYMDPEYFSTHRLTRKSDVYAFGVVLLEVLCGRPAVDLTLDEQQHSLVGWAKQRIKKGYINRIIDPCLKAEVEGQCLKKFGQIAYECVLDSSKDRPTMTMVVARLEVVLACTLQSMHTARNRKHIKRSMFIDKAALPFGAAGLRPYGTKIRPPSLIPMGDYSISPNQLASMTRDHDFSALQSYGGVKGLSEKLKTNPDNGIHDDESNILERKTVFGTNTYPRKKGRSFWRFVLETCQDITLIILMVAAAASLASGIKKEGIKEGWYNGGSIALAVIVVIVVTAISDYKQSLQFQNLNEEKQNIHLEAVRGGRRVKISIFDIVVGDVIPLKIGDQVPADGILIFGHSLSIDESSMTGKSTFVHKDQKAPFLMSGCKVADGYGSMLVTSVGINTEWGLLMASISEDNGEETPLQVRLNGVATFIGLVGLMVAVAVLIILLVRYFTGHLENPDKTVQFTAGKTSLSDDVDGAIKIFTIAVTIVVVSFPEGLPLAVTLSLAYSMRKMMADKALVRRLSACETMGSATTICSDKTGTLTLNMMTVVEAYICGKKIDPPNNKSDLPATVISLLIEAIAQNTTGSVFLPEGGGNIEVSGSPTEKAILRWGVNLGMNFNVVRSESLIVHAFPFNSEKKQGGVAVKLPDSEVHIHWKGAAEIVLAACTGYMDTNGTVVPLDHDKVEYFKKAIETMAAGSLRCVAIAYRSMKRETLPGSEEELKYWQMPEDDLVLLAIVGLKDPCRPNVKEAVQLCIKSGVKVRMVTGDNLQTARAIALECGILESNADAKEPNLIEGKTFRGLSESQRLEVADKISVMGRSSPNDKLLLVQALRKNGHVVAVTGDGTNDAPALHEADIGLAMGIQGTEVAKESSDIIILDDNFASVVRVVRWGRSVYANIQKFIQFQLTINVAALVINIVAAISSGDIPLNMVQLLWVNLIMDTLGALALATEPPTDHLMDRIPVGRWEPLITNIMWRNLLIQAMYQVTFFLVLHFDGRKILNLEHESDERALKKKNTIIFNAFVFSQIFNEFNARKPYEMNVFKGVTKNHLFMGIISFTIVLQVIIIMFLGKFTTTVRLSWQLWLVSIVIGVISWPLAVIGKLIPVSDRPFAQYFISFYRSCRASCSRDRGSPKRNLDNA